MYIKNTNSSTQVLPWDCRKGEKRVAKVKKEISAMAGSVSLWFQWNHHCWRVHPKLSFPQPPRALSSRCADLRIVEVKLETVAVAIGIATGLEDFSWDMKSFQLGFREKLPAISSAKGQSCHLGERSLTLHCQPGRCRGIPGMPKASSLLAIYPGQGLSAAASHLSWWQSLSLKPGYQFLPDFSIFSRLEHHSL